jgi:hypothetical protein
MKNRSTYGIIILEDEYCGYDLPIHLKPDTTNGISDSQSHPVCSSMHASSITGLTVLEGKTTRGESIADFQACGRRSADYLLLEGVLLVPPHCPPSPCSDSPGAPICRIESSKQGSGLPGALQPPESSCPGSGDTSAWLLWSCKDYTNPCKFQPCGGKVNQSINLRVPNCSLIWKTWILILQLFLSSQLRLVKGSSHSEHSTRSCRRACCMPI